MHSNELKGQTNPGAQNPGAQSVNVKQLRHELRDKWLTYYYENREWLVQLGIWVTCDGHHRPSSSFILATLSVLEPNLTRLMPLLAGLNSSPDRIVSALGLNFSPEERVEQWLHEKAEAASAMKAIASAEAQMEVAFHPEATLVSDAVEPSSSNSLSIEPQQDNGHQPISGQANNQQPSNNHQPGSNLPVANDRSAESNRPSDFNGNNASSNGHDPDAIAIEQVNVSQVDMIARRDEECAGRERGGDRELDTRDNIWR